MVEIHIEEKNSWTFLKTKEMNSVDSYKGKYLFFSDDKETLLNLAEIIMKTYSLTFAKLPIEKNL